MNKELFKQIQDSIEKEPAHYDQENYGETVKNAHGHRKMTVSCGTPGCIAGHALALSGLWIEDEWMPLSDAAMMELDISRAEAFWLFDTKWPESWLENVSEPLAIGEYGESEVTPSPQDAIKVIDRIINYGFTDISDEEEEWYDNGINSPYQPRVRPIAQREM